MTLVLILAGLWLAMAFAATGARVLAEFPAHELERACRNDGRREACFEEVMDDHEEAADAARALALILAGVWSIGTFGAVCGSDAWLAVATGPWWTALGGILVGLLAAHLWIPMAVQAQDATRFVLATWPFWRTVRQVGRPLEAIGRLATHLVRRVTGSPPATPAEAEEAFEDEIRAMVAEGAHDGLLAHDHREMIERVIRLNDATVRQIMTPRRHIEAVEAGCSWSDLLAFVVRVRRTRIPVYDRELDRIRGILHVKELLPELARPESDRRPWPELLRPHRLVPPTLPVDELLRAFRRERFHLAIVQSEFGQVVGLVTIEDALEQIVGEIEDEYDERRPPTAVEASRGRYEVDGWMPVAEFNERYAADIPIEDDYVTIAGWIVHRLRRVPRPKERFHIDGYEVVILDASDRAVQRLLVVLQREGDPAQAAG